MNFYEELGVPLDAAPETIRDAYRNAARLLHPDLQTDPELKDSAEARMKHLNHVYGILSHREQRRRYDLELSKSVQRVTPFEVDVKEMDSGRGGLLVWIAAIGVCALLIVWVGTRESSSGPAVYPVQSPAAQKQSVNIPATVVRSKVAATPNVQEQDDETKVLRGKLLAVDAERQTRVVPAPAPLENLTPLPLAASPRNQEIAAAVLPHVDPPAAPANWTGAWSYRGTQTGSRELFPPEFIYVTIAEESGRIQGSYRARFKVSNPAISPDVNFHFAGEVSGNGARMKWSGEGGSAGEVQLRLISASEMEIKWSATNLGETMGLDSGTAVLGKK